MAIEIPDSATAQAAAGLAFQAAPTFLLNHSYRTFLFGAASVTGDVDHEAAFVVAMVYDLGLTDMHRGDKDFGEVGAALAARFLEHRGWDRDRVRLVGKAILRHSRLIHEVNPTIRVVQVGAHIDVAGRGVRKLDERMLAGVLRAYPRLDFPQRMRNRIAPLVGPGSQTGRMTRARMLSAGPTVMACRSPAAATGTS
jgi:hypothetical protein